MDKSKELAINTVIITVGKICTQFVSFLLLPFYTALLSTEEYGTVDLFNTYVSLLLPIVIFQIDQAFFRYMIEVREDRGSQESVVSTVFTFALFQAVVFSLLFLILQKFINISYIYQFLLNILACIFSSLMLQATRGLGDNLSYSLGSVISGITQIICNVLFIAVFHMGVTGMLLAAFIGNIFCGFFLLFKKRLYSLFRISKFNMQDLKKYLKFSIPLIPNGLCWWIIGASDRSIVSYFLGVSSTGLLSVSNKFSSVYITILNIFLIPWYESAALHINDVDGDKFLKDIINTVFRVFLAANIGIIAVMQFVFGIMVNSKFDGAYNQIPIYMLAALFNVLIGLYSVVYQASKNTKEVAKTSIGAAIINILVNLILIKHIGLYAASISTLIAFIVMGVYRYIDIKKYINVPLERNLVLSAIFIYVIVLVCYYSDNFPLKIVALALAIIYAIIINRDLCKSILSNMKQKISKPNLSSKDD